LEKGRYKNAEKNNAYFTPADFTIDQDVKINGFSFHILEADEITKKWYAQYFKQDI
jgi:EF-hand domain-containing protein 1